MAGTASSRGRRQPELDSAAAAQASAAATFPASLTAPRQARSAIRAALTGWGLPGLADDAELLTSELIANAAEHGTGPIGLTVRTQHPAQRANGGHLRDHRPIPRPARTRPG